MAGAPYEPRARRPIWEQIADRLRAACGDGKLAADTRLPGENLMAETFGVTRVTMRRALARLQQEGWLHARKGVGIFVRPIPLRYRLDHDRHFSDGLAIAPERIATRTLSLSRGEATDDEARSLSLPPGGAVIRLTRLRAIDAAPVYLARKIFPAARFPDFHAAYDAGHSVRQVYQAHGIPDYRRGETRVTGGFASTAEAGALRLTPRTPVLRTAAVNVDGCGRAIEYTLGTWPLTAVELVLRDQRRD